MKITIINPSENLETAIADFFSGSVRLTLSAAQRGIYCHLLLMCNNSPEHSIDSTIKALATEVGVCASTLSRHLHVFEQAGLLELSHRRKTSKAHETKIAEMSEDSRCSNDYESHKGNEKHENPQSSKNARKFRRKLSRRQRKAIKSRLTSSL